MWAKLTIPFALLQWVGPNGEVRDHTSDVPDTGIAAKRDEAKRLKDQAQQKKEEVKQEGKERATNVANAADNAQQAEAGPATSHVGTEGSSTSPSNLAQGASSTGYANGQPPYYGGGNVAQPGQSLSQSAGGFSNAGGMSDAQQEEAKQRAQAGANAGQGQAKAEAKDVKNKVLNAIPDEHKDRVNEQIDRTKVSHHRFCLSGPS